MVNKMPTNYEVIPVRRLLSNVVSLHAILSQDITINPQNIFTWY